ncbi:MAG: zf-HC2 domain-containing protein [Deltaproteobacteria bacterium]|jgi:hypothetical protein
MNLFERTRLLFSPHARAERLIDDHLDAARGEASLPPSDQAWLEQHLEGCVSCRAVRDERHALLEAMRAAPTERAPTGFAGRVLMAAKARADVEPEVVVPERRFGLGGVAALAMVAGLFVFAAIIPTGKDGGGGVQVSGHATELQDRPHFVVRAPGVGAAKVRAQITSIVTAHEGTLEAAGDDVLVRIPRAELIGAMQDLAQRGRFKVSKADAGEIGPGVETIVIRFELD